MSQFTVNFLITRKNIASYQAQLIEFVNSMKQLTSLFILPKGQLISKGLFGILNSSKKRTKKFDLTTMILQLELFSFVFWKILDQFHAPLL